MFSQVAEVAQLVQVAQALARVTRAGSDSKRDSVLATARGSVRATTLAWGLLQQNALALGLLLPPGLLARFPR
jgi:hypothetical protein